MMKYLQKLGKSLMLPIICLPIAGILMGIGYWIDPSGFGANNIIAAFLLNAGGSIIDNMALLFAIGVGFGMSDDNDGTAALAGLVSWLVITTLLSPDSVAFFKRIDVLEVNPAFGNIQNQFIGILSGIIGASCYNRFKNVKTPDFLALFSGKRSVSIFTALFSMVASLILFFIWPVVYNGLVAFGTMIISTGPFGAAIYGFFNRILIPVGLHHALNSVFWFDVANINDIANFWGRMSNGVYGQTGMYMTGFFPIMMFGLPGGALAMYHTAKPKNKKFVGGLLLSAAFSAFFIGITEPLEFSFMFLAPGLYVIHALLTSISMFICTIISTRCGFNFSAGFVDWILSFKAPMAQNPWLVIPIGLVFSVLYYFIFKFAITKFNLKTIGREDDQDEEKKVSLSNENFSEVAAIIIEGLGGLGNIKLLDNCITRLRVEVKEPLDIDESKIKSSGVSAVIRPSKYTIQIVVGMQVQRVADEIKKMLLITKS